MMQCVVEDTVLAIAPRPPVLSNSHFEGFEDTATPYIGTGINCIPDWADPLRHPPNMTFWIHHWNDNDRRNEHTLITECKIVMVVVHVMKHVLKLHIGWENFEKNG